MPEIEYVWDELSDKWQKKGAEKGDAVCRESKKGVRNRLLTSGIELSMV